MTEAQEIRSMRRQREGVVIGNKMDKTVVVRVDQRIRHRQYTKEVTRARKFYAHDEKNEAQMGDVVRIAETRPLSRLKRWRLVEIVRKANV